MFRLGRPSKKIFPLRKTRGRIYIPLRKTWGEYVICLGEEYIIRSGRPGENILSVKEDLRRIYYLLGRPGEKVLSV